MVCSIYGCDPNRLAGDHDMIKNGGPLKQIRGISNLMVDMFSYCVPGFEEIN